jgi:hypothetical protein
MEKMKTQKSTPKHPEFLGAFVIGGHPVSGWP